MARPDLPRLNRRNPHCRFAPIFQLGMMVISRAAMALEFPCGYPPVCAINPRPRPCAAGLRMAASLRWVLVGEAIAISHSGSPALCSSPEMRSLTVEELKGPRAMIRRAENFGFAWSTFSAAARASSNLPKSA